ncbi:hypothetical protein ACJ73_00334 [Blastomyces percursus]|uniref:Uncharacterized protein n=1 Tax=Blastomyces percursus TaxID=1658174 RepID=A0A1J9RI78_9EURO|nr:hypothetical protein ACJ73_00334 [Blastomyces percursus]
MVSSGSLRVFDVLRELNRRRTIPLSYQKILEERLIITLKPLATRLERSKTRRPKEEYQERYKEKKAQKVYSEILEDYPHIFIPFILAIQPRACQRFDLEKFRQHDLTDRIDLGNDVQAMLGSIAQKEGFNQNPLYKLLIESLFPYVSYRTQKPITSAETNNYWAYQAADLKAIRNIFGNDIYQGIEKSSTRILEAKCQTLQTTECVGMKLPKQNYQDAIISLEICLTEDLVKTLFPPSWKKILSAASLSTPGACDQKSIPLVKTPGYQDGLSSKYALENSVLFQEASVSAIPSIFGPRMGDAIEKSQLREWEKSNSSHNTIDCVSIEIHPQQPHNSTFHLRVGFIAGTYIASKLYA